MVVIFIYKPLADAAIFVPTEFYELVSVTCIGLITTDTHTMTY